MNDSPSSQLRGRIRAIAFHCGKIIDLFDEYELSSSERDEIQYCINHLGESLETLAKTSQSIEMRIDYV